MSKKFYSKHIDSGLLAMLGSKELVERWWLSPNKRWNGQTPQSIWNTDNWTEVYDYVMTYCYGK